MGALVMAHSDDKGLILPPKLAPDQVVIVPIYRSDEEYQKVCKSAEIIRNKLIDKNISVKLDARDTHKPGWKFAEYEMKGVPVRLALGPRDIENNTVEVVRRDTSEKETQSQEGIEERILLLLEEIQNNIYNKALKFRTEHTHKADTYDEFKDIINNGGGFVSAHWDGTIETENKIKNKTKATIRCIPNDVEKEEGKCMISGKPSYQRVLFAKAY